MEVNLERIENKLRMLGLKVRVESIKQLGVYGISIGYIPPQIKRLVIPEGITYLGRYREASDDITLSTYNGDLEEIKLLKSLQVVGDNVFRGYIELKEIRLPEGLKKIGEQAFKDCFNLSKIEGIERLETIRKRAFNNCPLKGDIIINRNIKELGMQAFSNTRIRSIDFNKSEIEEISEGLFERCVNLERVKGLTDRVKIIKPYAFFTCDILQSVEKLGNLKEIGHSAFKECRKLVLKLGNPEMITEIEEDNFNDLDGIEIEEQYKNRLGKLKQYENLIRWV